MTRRALARVAPVLLLLVGGFGALGLSTFASSATHDRTAVPADRDRAPTVAAEAASNDAVAVTFNRPADDSRRGAVRLFSIVLAALVALLALFAARLARSFVAFAAHRDLSLEARRRGPPQLRCI
ncbi:MAG: hypothetical protein ABW033_06400 [Acidimicrobiia bacterium]